MSVRSGILGRGRVTVANTPVKLFTVPAGQTYIIKDWRAMNRNATSAALGLYVNTAGAPPFMQIINGVQAFALMVSGQGFICCHPGDECWATSDQATADFWVSGAALVGTI